MQTLKIVRSGRVKEPTTRYTTPDIVHSKLAKEMRSLDREHFMVIHLDTAFHLIAKETISIGSLNQTTVHPREVFKGAVLNGSCALLLVHNHPSGDPRPSDEDIAITNRLKETGEILGIRIVDHLIFGDHCFYSFEGAIKLRGKRAKEV